jgi:hypothetical protein
MHIMVFQIFVTYPNNNFTYPTPVPSRIEMMFVTNRVYMTSLENRLFFPTLA